MSWSRALFTPESVAVVGSVGEGKIGRVLIEQLLDGGFAHVAAVNPKAQRIRGIHAAGSFEELVAAHAPVDLAVIASPAATVADVLEDAGAAGVKAAIVITAGFSESGDGEAEARLVDIARRHGMRIVGPNCAGIVNTKHRLFPTLETRPPAGDVAFVSQSGALGGAVLSWAEAQGVGFSKFVSYGNGADLTDIDFLEYLTEDPESRVVCLYIETVSDGRKFLKAASRVAAVKPLIVIKAGRSSSGMRATMSHTGSMAGSDAIYDAALKQCGAIRVDGIEEMFDLCRAFTKLRPLRGTRLAIVTNSGGPGVLASDRAEACGLTVAPPSETLRAKLAEGLPAFCSVGNPFDLTVQGGEAEYRETIRAVSAEYDAVLALNVNVPYLDAAPLARGVVDAASSIDTPVAASFLAGRTVESALPVLAEGGVPAFATGERAVAALASLARQAHTAKGRGPFAAGDAERVGGYEELPWSEQPLEPEVMDWLEEHGVSVIERGSARTADEAVAAAERIGYPVAAKVVSREILHKTDVGGVVLDLSNAPAVRNAFEHLAEICGGRSFQGVLVSRMAADPVEAIVGLTRDPQFGPIVAIGLGGIHTEVLGDLALRVAPIEKDEALRAINELHGAPILRGVRGRGRLDIDALASLVEKISQLGVQFPEINELDLNPVFLFEAGSAVADARLIPSSRASERSDGR